MFEAQQEQLLWRTFRRRLLPNPLLAAHTDLVKVHKPGKLPKSIVAHYLIA